MDTQYLQDLTQQFLDQCQNLKHGRYDLNIMRRIANDLPVESYTSSYAGSELAIATSGESGACYGLAFQQVAAKAGHLGEYLGHTKPRFSLRPLWLNAHAIIPLSQQVSVHLPDFMEETEIDYWLPRFCSRMYAYGFNAVILGSHSGIPKLYPSTKRNYTDLALLVKRLKDYGIYTIFKPNFNFDSKGTTISPYNSDYCHQVEQGVHLLLENVSGVHSLFWESGCMNAAFRRETTLRGALGVEAVLAEVILLEKTIAGRCKLNFYLPAHSYAVAERQATWMSQLLDEINPRTTLVFNSVCGGIYDDHHLEHPYWHKLRKEPDSSATSLMSIINIGMVGHGEGLWPTSSSDLIERFVSRCRRHPFAGMISIAGRLPREGSFLDSQLWIGGQALWRDLHPDLLAETWFSAYHGNEALLGFNVLLKRARLIALQLAELRNADCMESSRKQGESLPHVVRQLETTIEKLQFFSQANALMLKEQFFHFCSDVRRVLERSLQLSPFAVGASRVPQDGNDRGFWTDPRGRGELLDEPQKADPGTIMEAILKQHRLYS